MRITNFFCRACGFLGLLSESKRLSTWASRGITSQQRSGVGGHAAAMCAKRSSLAPSDGAKVRARRTHVDAEVVRACAAPRPPHPSDRQNMVGYLISYLICLVRCRCQHEVLLRCCAPKRSTTQSRALPRRTRLSQSEVSRPLQSRQIHP